MTRSRKKPKASMRRPSDGISPGRQTEQVGKQFLTFSFADFHGESTEIKNKFNNFYQDEDRARKGVYAFLEAINKVSKYDLQAFQPEPPAEVLLPLPQSPGQGHKWSSERRRESRAEPH